MYSQLWEWRSLHNWLTKYSFFIICSYMYCIPNEAVTSRNTLITLGYLVTQKPLQPLHAPCNVCFYFSTKQEKKTRYLVTRLVCVWNQCKQRVYEYQSCSLFLCMIIPHLQKCPHNPTTEETRTERSWKDEVLQT